MRAAQRRRLQRLQRLAAMPVVGPIAALLARAYRRRMVRQVLSRALLRRDRTGVVGSRRAAQPWHRD